VGILSPAAPGRAWLEAATLLRRLGLSRRPTFENFHHSGKGSDGPFLFDGCRWRLRARRWRHGKPTLARAWCSDHGVQPAGSHLFPISLRSRCMAMMARLRTLTCWDGDDLNCWALAYGLADGLAKAGAGIDAGMEQASSRIGYISTLYRPGTV
jgi:hypothetical protein